MQSFKQGQKVTATTLRGTSPVAGKVAAIHPSSKGDWYEIQPNSGGDTFRTRASKITAA